MRTTYYLLFSDSSFFGSFLFKKKCRHVILFSSFSEKRHPLYVLNPSGMIIQTSQIFFVNEEYTVEKYLHDHTKHLKPFCALKLDVDYDFNERQINKLLYIPLNSINCVSIVKYFLGINKLFILTPYMLYKYLINIKNHKYIKSVEVIDHLCG